ncbi:MAG: insulinase family protein [Pseudohongiellaceae bacterium]
MADVSTTFDHNTPTPAQFDSAHPAFAWRRSERIDSLNLVMEEYVHKATGAVHYHLASDNPENVFLVAFRTVPMDSTGVAHILEHTALCGSKRFPVRDPFFMMIRRSLNTFMNAFTSSDWTAYPFASRNHKDFYNLLNVYLDAAFFSRLHPLDFAQEGHRLEFSEADNPESELQYKGVVYNEMKGAMSSTNSVLWHTMCNYLFPSTTYHYNSGGEPDHIPDLSYQQLIDFYKSHYHPSNAIFMTFGDIPAAQHHEQFETLALSHFEKLDTAITVADEKRYLAPLRVEEYYAVDEVQADKHHVVVGWLLGHSTNLTELFEAQLLTSVLLDHSASPLLRVLETTGLGAAPSPLCGLEDSNREMSFMAGLEGCREGSTRDVEALVQETLRELADNGVDQDQVEASLHQLELSQREISGDSFPYGLQLILTGLSTALHHGDPIELLDLDPVIDRLRERIKDRQFIPELIHRLLLDNPHRVILTLSPDDGLARRKVEAEKRRLAAIKANLSPADSQRLVQQAAELTKRQAQVDDPGLLPKVGLEDVPAQIIEPQRQQLTLPTSADPVSFYAQGTNGLSYQQVVFQLPALEEELLQVLPLYSACVAEFGVGELDYSQVQTWQAQVSGGINCFSSIRSNIDDEQKMGAIIAYSSKCLAHNHERMSELLQRTLLELRFDEEQRLYELVEQIFARKEASITGQGHSLAMNLASSRMSPTAHLSHTFGGLAGIRWLKETRDALKDVSAREALLGKFQRLHELVTGGDQQFLLIGEEDQQESMLAQLDGLWPGAASATQEALVLPPLRERVRQAWTTATQVSFCAKAFPTVPSAHADNAVLHVLAGFLRNGFLHRAIRERGGAYGGGASQDGNSASFRFFSYRDPRLQDTLDDFDRAIRWVVEEKHGEHQVEEAILGVIGTMDKSTSPAGEAKQAFYNNLFGRTLDHRMGFRERVLDTTLADLRRVAEQYFAPETASIGLVSNRELLEGLTETDVEIINL